jgi:DNA-binding transcriptional LysR family regulator
MAIRQAALEGLGIALIPVAYVREDLADGGLVNVLPDWRGEPQGLFAVYPAHRESSFKIRLLVDFLRHEFAAIT